MKADRTSRLILFFAVMFVLAIWETMSRVGFINPLFFPAPSIICTALVRIIGSGRLLPDVGLTLLRLIGGYALGAVPGFCLGLLMGWSRNIRRFADPLLAVLHPMPKTAVLPLFMVILGIGESSKLAVIAVSSFFPVVINAMVGVRQISPIHFEVAANHNASLWKVFTRIVLPGSLPLTLAGMRLAFNIAVHVTIAVELLAARHGLGAVIWMAWETMRTEELYIGVAVSGLIGFVFSDLLRRVSERLLPWHVERQMSPIKD